MPIKKTVHPEYLTTRECQAICRYKGTEPIRRAVARGDLPGVRVSGNRLLIPAKEFWRWFHRKNAKWNYPPDIDLFEPEQLKRERELEEIKI